jgi:hypothetical protein
MLLKPNPGAVMISIGQHSKNTLNQYGIENYNVPHPSMGGVNGLGLLLVSSLKEKSIRFIL